jgi:hypothetical protein
MVVTATFSTGSALQMCSSSSSSSCFFFLYSVGLFLHSFSFFFSFLLLFLLKCVLIEKFHATHETLFFLFLSFFFLLFTKYLLFGLSHALHVHHAFNKWSMRSIHHFSIYYIKKKEHVYELFFCSSYTSSKLMSHDRKNKNNIIDLYEKT